MRATDHNVIVRRLTVIRLMTRCAGVKSSGGRPEPLKLFSHDQFDLVVMIVRRSRAVASRELLVKLIGFSTVREADYSTNGLLNHLRRFPKSMVILIRRFS